MIASEGTNVGLDPPESGFNIFCSEVDSTLGLGFRSLRKSERADPVIDTCDNRWSTLTKVSIESLF